MNKKAQTQEGIGMFIMVFVTVVVGLILFQIIAQDVGLASTSITTNNYSIEAADMPALDAAIDLNGQDLLSTPVVLNGTTGETIATGNYTIGERVSPTTGVKTIYFQLDDAQNTGANLTANGGDYINITTYTYGPDGYINSASGRSVASLIIIFFALAIVVIVLTPNLRGKLADSIGR